MDATERMYRALLVLYPRGHRDEYGEPMVQLLRDRLRDERNGPQIALLWAQLVTDLLRTVIAERLETTMQMLRRGWWRFAAGAIAVAMVLLGIGNLYGGDPGPLYGKVLAVVAALALAAVTFGGLWVHRRDPSRGSLMVGIGVLPAATLTIMFWWPPVAAVGLLALVVATRAFLDIGREQRTTSAHLPG